MFLIVSPFTSELSAGVVVVDSSTVLLSVQKKTFVLIFVCVDNFTLVSSPVIYPLSIVNSARSILKNSVAVASILHPVSNVSVTVPVVVCSLSMLLAIQPAALVLLSPTVEVHSESRLPIFKPLTVIDSTRAILINTATMLASLSKLTLIAITSGEEIDAVSMKFVFLPEAKINIPIGECIDSSAVPTFKHLSDILRAVVVGKSFVFLFELSRLFIELAGELLFEPGSLVLRQLAERDAAGLLRG